MLAIVQKKLLQAQIGTMRGPASGDLGGTYPGPSVQKVKGVTPSAYILTILPAVDAPTTRTLLGLATIAATGSAADLAAGTIPVARYGSQSQNYVLAGPGSAGAGAATWRLLVAADIPALDASKITSGTIDPARLPSAAITSVTVVANQAARLALSVDIGDAAKQTDTGETYILQALPASTNSNWVLIGDISPDWTVISNKPTTLAGYAITDAQAIDAGLTSIAGLTGPGYLKASATDTFAMVTTIPWTDLSSVPAALAYTNLAQTWTFAQLFRAANGVRSENAATQDAIVVAGRAGGTGSYQVTLIPATLSAAQTATYPDASGTVMLRGSLTTYGLPMFGASGIFVDSGLTYDGSETVSVFCFIPGADPTTPNNADVWFATAGSQRNRVAGVSYTVAYLEMGTPFTAALVTNSPTAGCGYATGAGGTVTQATSKSTGVTLNKVCGTITLNAASLAANTGVAFTLTDSAITATDLVVCHHDSVGTLGAYGIVVTPGAGSATVTVRNLTSGALAEALVLRFAIIKAVTT